jgi:hypothetical protein
MDIAHGFETFEDINKLGTLEYYRISDIFKVSTSVPVWGEQH